MRAPAIVVLAALASSALSAGAAPPLCANGAPPALNGDLFSPAECSTATKPSPMLPSLPARSEGEDVKTDLKDLAGRWEGLTVHGLGRYELLLTVKTGWGSKADLTLETKELQFRQRLTDRLSLRPAKARGEYEAVMSTSLVPEASLKGRATLGAERQPEGSKEPAARQADLVFANGAAHRVVFSLKGKDELVILAFSAVPGAPLQKLEMSLKRTKREAL